MNFTVQLKQHLNFIERSCASYDVGHNAEALRIAVSLRVMFHDTNQSISLLKHLGVKDSVKLISTLSPEVHENQGTEQLLIHIPIMLTSKGVSPPLGKLGNSRLLKVRDWWEEIIMLQKEAFSRRDIILSAANQDGGAHVDANPNKKTRELKQGVGIFSTSQEGVEKSIALTDHHLPLLRQIGYEVLSSEELVALI